MFGRYHKPPQPKQSGERFLDENLRVLPRGCWVAATDEDGLLACAPDVVSLRSKLPERILKDPKARYAMRFIK